MPPQVNISINLSILEWLRKEAEATLIYKVNYLPSLAQISLKGHVCAAGEKREVHEVLEAQKQRKPPPPTVFQAVTVSESTDVSTPIPPLPKPSTEQKTPPQKPQPCGWESQ